MKIHPFLTTLGTCTALLYSTASAVTVIGTGNGALLGSDLTDPENDGVDDNSATGQNFNATFFATGSASFNGNGGAFQVFSNSLTDANGGGNGHKYCCGGPTAAGFIIGANLGTPVVLSHFTLASSNDSPGRDPDVYQIQGSNDTTTGLDGTWTDIYAYDNDGGTTGMTATQMRLFAGNTQFTDRNQVLRFDGAGDDYATPAAYSSFRINMQSSSGWVGAGDPNDPAAALALGEIEFFGNAVPEPSSALLISLAGLGLLRRRR